MSTSYDTIFTKFIGINKTESINIPTNESKIYEMITNAVDSANNRMRTNYTYDNTEEVVNEVLDIDTILIIAHFIKLNFLENSLTYYVTLMKPFTKEIGLLHYNADVKALESLIANENSRIDEILKNMCEDDGLEV